MRKFSSYGPVNTKLHYYVPRKELLDRAFRQLLGEDPNEGGHYITVWAPRQRGKTWIMHQVVAGLNHDPQYATYDVVIIGLEDLKLTTDVDRIARIISERVIHSLKLKTDPVNQLSEMSRLFTRDVLSKPLILILDEFDALIQEAINGLAGMFRNIYNARQGQFGVPRAEKEYQLHGVALIGVRSVLGIENKSGSPFNVQRSLHIPNLTFEEVESMYRWYEQESGQVVEQAVIDQVFYETQGQPGLTSWLGELLTETYNERPERPLDMDVFAHAYGAAIHVLPNANIVNIISKAKQEPYKDVVLELFQTDEKMDFRYDDPNLNFLYMNGVIDWETEGPDKYYVKFPCPLIQKRLFHYFANLIVNDVGQLYRPFEDLSGIITSNGLNIRNLMRRYEQYLQDNRSWLLRDVPVRADLRPYEAIFHFSLYLYLAKFLQRRDGRVLPEFPTGNGKIDLLLHYANQIYGLELKTYIDTYEYTKAVRQAARYGKELQLSEIWLIFFVEYIDDENRQKYEAEQANQETDVLVKPVFVATGTT
ncbi:AAA-like domain-containing protein [Chloroflexi bacterium TSY]|nr:AAA-like domain-containing protein [Chloroflexi bacterium TSY]